MQTAMGEEEKEAKDFQEFSTGAVTLERGLIDSDHADGKVRASRIYVDDEEIKVDLSEHDDGEQGSSKTIPGSLLEEGDMEKIFRALDPPSPFAVYTTPGLRSETLFVEDSIGLQEQDNYGAQQGDQRVREKTKDDTDYETADELGQEIKGQEKDEKQDSRQVDRPHIPSMEEQESGSKIKMSSGDDPDSVEAKKIKTPVKSLIQKYNNIMKPNEDHISKKKDLSRQGNQAKGSGVNKKKKYGHGKEVGNYKDRIQAQKKVKAEKNMSKVTFAINVCPKV